MVWRLTRHQRGSLWYQAVPLEDDGDAAPLSTQLQMRSRIATLIRAELGSTGSAQVFSRSSLPAGMLHRLGSVKLGAMDPEIPAGTESGAASDWVLESRSLELLPGELKVSCLQRAYMAGVCVATCPFAA